MLRSRPFHARTIRAFTLIELLTVIAIIGILAAVMIPTISAARARATETKVLVHMRQLGMAMRAYATDHHDYLPCANYNYGSGLIAPWDEVILPYLGIKPGPQGWVAPSAEPLFFHPNDEAQADPNRARRSFAMPREGKAIIGGRTTYPVGNLNNTSRPDYIRGTNLQQIKNGFRVILLTERRNMGNSSFVNSGSFADINVAQLTQQIYTPEQTHKINGNGRLDFLFVDGHVAALKLEDTVGKDEFGSIASPKGMWFIQ